MLMMRPVMVMRFGARVRGHCSTSQHHHFCISGSMREVEAHEYLCSSSRRSCVSDNCPMVPRPALGKTASWHYCWHSRLTVSIHRSPCVSLVSVCPTALKVITYRGNGRIVQWVCFCPFLSFLRHHFCLPCQHLQQRHFQWHPHSHCHCVLLVTLHNTK